LAADHAAELTEEKAALTAQVAARDAEISAWERAGAQEPSQAQEHAHAEEETTTAAAVESTYDVVEHADADVQEDEAADA
jgi:hypothetical protein